MFVMKSHDAEQHAGVGEYVGTFVAVNLHQFHQCVNRFLRLVDCRCCPSILHRQTSNNHHSSAIMTGQALVDVQQNIAKEHSCWATLQVPAHKLRVQFTEGAAGQWPFHFSDRQSLNSLMQ